MIQVGREMLKPSRRTGDDGDDLENNRGLKTNTCLKTNAAGRAGSGKQN